ncbi:MAG: prolyl oligopeptidase family serine peptidase, partial [Candidatus Aenigmarchaeota archaeon]|nr:prolyl oligopeptidase family serine peptidase [Candidatus Aenigmarchaeota archaeon]
MIDLYIIGSTWDMFGDDFQSNLDGIYLEKGSGTLIIPDNSTNTSTTIKFINTSMGNLTYEFYEDNFSVVVNLTASSGDVSFFVTPDIDYMSRINQTGTTNSEDLSNGIGADYTLWKDVTYTTFENAYIRIYETQSSIAKTIFYSNQQVWGIGMNSPSYMTSGGNYAITISIDSASFIPKPDVVNISTTAGGFNITTTNFSATIINNGIMDNLTISGSIWDMLGDDIQSKLDGIYLANNSGQENIIYATSYNISDNRIFFNSSIGTWIYKFSNNEFKIIIDLSTSEDMNFFVVPNIDYIVIINQTGTNNCEDLSDSIGKTQILWKDVTYTTFENVYIRMYEQAIAQGKTNYYLGQQIWGLNDKGAPGSISAGRYVIIFNINTSNFVQKEDTVTISKISGGYNITANYTAFVTEKGMMRDLYAGGSKIDMFGNYFSNVFEGVYLTENSDHTTIINATSNIRFSNNIIFYSPKANWTYKFDTNKIDIIVKTASDSGSIDFYASPDISYMSQINQTGTLNSEDLFDEMGANYVWRNVTFTTTENVFLDMYLNSYIGTEAKAITGFHNNVQHWGFEDWDNPSGAPMKQSSEYSIRIGINASEIDVYRDIIDITPVSGGYNISSQRFYYNGFVTDKGILTDLFLQKGPNDFFDNNGSLQMYDGLYFTENDHSTTINATSSVISGNRIFFNSSIGLWRYDFSNKQIKLIIKTNSNSGNIDLWMTPNPEIILMAFDRENSTNTIDLSNGCSCNNTYIKPWSEAGYKTIFGDWITAYLYNHPVGSTEGQMGCCCGNNIEHWGLESKTSPSGGPIKPSEIYKVIFDLNPRVIEILDFQYTRSFDGQRGKGTFLIPSNYSVYDFDQLPLVVCTHDFLSNKSDCFNGDFVEAINDKNWFMVSAEGYGRTENDSYYSNGTELGWMGSQHDVLDAINYMKTNFRVNENKVYWIGMGDASTIAVAKNPDVFAAGASWFGISNISVWKEEIDNGYIGNVSWSQLIENEIGGNQTDYPFEYKRRSSIYYQQNFKHVPLKFFHGENDTFVNYTQSQNLYNALHIDNLNTSYNWTNTGHCIDCINKNTTLDWLENFTRPNFSSILNLEIKTDESKSFYWVEVGLFNYNLPGPDIYDSTDVWGFINVSVNDSTNTVKMHTQNINYTLLDIDETQINQSEIMYFNITSNITDILVGFKNSNATFILDINSSSINISTDNNLLPLGISVIGIWNANITGIINRPYAKSAEFNLINSLWNESTIKLSSTINITSNKNISFFIPNNTYSLGEWEFINESGYILKNSSATGVINLSVASIGMQALILQPETNIPKINFILPTPNNNTEINTSYIYINATIIDNSNISACILSWNGTNITMDKLANNCYKNITGLNDVWQYNYRIYANDTWGNRNASGLMNVSVNYNNAPTNPNLIFPLNHYRFNKTNITFMYNSTDNDTEDTIIYYIYINGSLNKSTSQNSTNIILQEGFYNWST